ncbi:hypothetical protein F7734_02950 [Scytonema sp. UIC 10036]|uniref:hypothetical protein n=1 Tax=Scytonema sp. UIC 10036 TaxID=2304196 RepID=UPI0012DA03A6|nr:hypothetical protein [Scytonema sp. UIC 10036]MUG91501.1 hypothetical protein [Scytonema sp. UIC 10036]
MSLILLSSMFNTLIIGAFIVLAISLPISIIFLIKTGIFQEAQDKIIVISGMLNGIWLVSTAQVEMGTLEATHSLFFSFIIMIWSVAGSTALLLQNFQYKNGKLQARLATAVTASLGIVVGILPYLFFK